MRGRLSTAFFARAPQQVARELLGTCLVRRLDGRRIAGRVVEAEAYGGPEDTACHASKGRTGRNQIMFGPPGLAYVYFSYGMHWLLNVVAGEEGFPAAVLIRAVEPVEGADVMRRLRGDRPDRELAAGPARLCQAFGIEGSFYGADLVRGETLFFERGAPVREEEVGASPRVGIDYAAKEDIRAPWRFFIRGNPFVSRARPGPPAHGRRARKRSRSDREGGRTRGR
jgi:DNA-3-methyladenine glycosylase